MVIEDEMLMEWAIVSGDPHLVLILPNGEPFKCVADEHVDAALAVRASRGGSPANRDGIDLGQLVVELRDGAEIWLWPVWAPGTPFAVTSGARAILRGLATPEQAAELLAAGATARTYPSDARRKAWIIATGQS